MGVEDQPARAIVETVVHEQFRFGTQTKECHIHLIAGQMEAKRRVVELNLGSPCCKMSSLCSSKRYRHSSIMRSLLEKLRRRIGYYSNGSSRRCRTCGLSMHNNWRDRCNPCEIHSKRGLQI